MAITQLPEKYKEFAEPITVICEDFPHLTDDGLDHMIKWLSDYPDEEGVGPVVAELVRKLRQEQTIRKNSR